VIGTISIDREVANEEELKKDRQAIATRERKAK